MVSDVVNELKSLNASKSDQFTPSFERQHKEPNEELSTQQLYNCCARILANCELTKIAISLT